MGLLGWVVTGLLAGGLARMATGAEKRGCLATLAIGVVGALIGGLLFNAVGARGDITGFGLWSVFVAFIGACILLLAFQLVTRRDR